MKNLMMAIIAVSATASAWAEDVTLDVASGTKAFAKAMEDCGIAAFPAKANLVKTGAGQLDALAVAETTIQSTITQVVVKAGTYHVTGYQNFGTANGDPAKPVRSDYSYGSVVIEDGATAYATGGGACFLLQTIHLKGHGNSTYGGAITLHNNAYGLSNRYVLDDDATIENRGVRHAQLFQKWSVAGSPATTIDLGIGHTLRFVNGDWAQTHSFGFYLPSALIVRGSGTIIADRAPLAQGDATFTATRDAGTTVNLVLTNAAPLLLTAPDTVRLFDDIRVCEGSTISTNTAVTAPLALTLKGISGTGSVAAGIKRLALSGALTVSVADLLAGKCLSVEREASFLTDAKIVIEGDWNALATTDGAEYEILSADLISGMPMISGDAHRRFSVVKSTDGKKLKIAYRDPKPLGAVDAVADWGLVSGLGETGNAAKFNAAMAAASADTVVYFPAGDYAFTEPLLVNGKSQVAIVGDGSRSVLRGSGLANVLAITNGTGVTVSDLALAGSTGPAVMASDTANLAVKNVFYASIGGAIADSDDRYPVMIVNGTGSYVRHNRVTDGATYTAPVLIDGGSTATGSEPLSNLVDIYVDEGEIEDFETAFAKTGYATYPAQKALHKSGPGTLIATNTLTTVMWGVRVAEGVMRFAKTDDVGVGGYGIVVSNGATAVFMPGMYIANRALILSGSGAPGWGAAVVAEGQFGAGNMSVRLNLGDATMISRWADNVCPMLSGGGSANASSLWLGGNTLTLKAENGSTGVATHYKLLVNESGRIVVDGTTLTDYSPDSSGRGYSRADGVSVTVALKNGAALKPKEATWMAMFDGVEGEAGTTVDCAHATATLDVTLAHAGGAPTFGSKITSLAITDSFTADAADLLAGNALTASCPIAVGNGDNRMKVAVKDPSGAFAQFPKSFCYPFVTSSESVSGKPCCDKRHSDVRAWSVEAGENTLNVVPPRGTLVIVM